MRECLHTRVRAHTPTDIYIYIYIHIYPLTKGALTGAIIALLINMWIVYGAVFAIENDQSLPPLPIDGCSPSLNVTFVQPTYKPV